MNIHAAHSPARTIPMPPIATRPKCSPLDRDGLLTPGGYMRNCRQRAKMTLDDVANKIALRLNDRAFVRARLADLEANRPGDYLALIESLRRTAAFAFSFSTFVGLAAQTIRLDVEGFDQ